MNKKLLIKYSCLIMCYLCSYEIHAVDNNNIPSNNNPLLSYNKNLYCAQRITDISSHVKNAWLFREISECIYFLSFYIANKPRQLEDSSKILLKALTLGDFLINNLNEQGVWWHPGSKAIGDPNVNRFTLSALLDGIYWLRKLPEGEERWQKWKGKLESAIKFQETAYRGQINWDWGANVRGRYPNQDVYYALIMALASELFNEPKFRMLGDKMILSIGNNLLPDGGFHYIGNENESPIYHGLMLVVLGRYYTLTGSQDSFELIKKTANYWPLVMSAEAVAEGWSDVWFKQGWQPIKVGALVIAAAVSGDTRNRWLLNQSLKYFPVNKTSLWSLYAIPFWDKLPDKATPLPKDFIWKDRNINGMHGRKGDWYFGFTQGRGFRNTFVGGFIGDSHQTTKMNGVFRGVQVSVLSNVETKSQLFLSDSIDQSNMAISELIGGALCANYNLQPNRISDISDKMTHTELHSWHVSQMWRAAKDGIIGMISIEPKQNLTDKSVIFKILLGPEKITKIDSGAWISGSLKIKLYYASGTVVSKQIATNPIFPTASNQWNGLEIINNKQHHKGEHLVLAAWIGPVSSNPPLNFEFLPLNRGWTAEWIDGHKTAVIYNQSSEPENIEIPWDSNLPKSWTSDAIIHKSLELKGGNIYFTEMPNECVLVDSQSF